MGALLALFSCGLFSFTSPVQEGYRMPPAEVVAIVDAALPPAVDFSPDAEMIE